MCDDLCAHGCHRVLERDATRTCVRCGCAVCVPCSDDACPSEAPAGYEIRPDLDHPRGGWTFAHKDYDGPPDRRCGHADSIQEAINQIEDLAEVEGAA